MLYFVLPLVFTVISPITSEDRSKTTCFNEKIGNSICTCELLDLDNVIQSDLETEAEASLTCIGEDSLEMAAEALTFRKRLLFTELTVSNGTLNIVDFTDFQNFADLKNLSLRDNSILTIGVETFKNQKYLEHLDLSVNNLTILPGSSFESLTHLKNLTLSYNQIHSIERKTFNNLHSLVYLDLSNNQLSELDCSWFAGLKNLQTLSLSSNRIDRINGSFHLSHLQQLDLSSNNLKHIQSATFFHLKNLRVISLATNELTTLDESTFKGNVNLQKINLAGNLWICNRKLLPLSEWLKKYESSRERALCTEPPDLYNYTLQAGIEIVNLEINIEESPTCNRSMCNCTVSKDKTIIVVDCSHRAFTRLPEVVPHKTKVVNLRNNNIKSLTTDHIDAAYWANVSFLYLSNNAIDSLKGLEGTWLLRNLVALHLSNNRLTEIPIHILEQFRGGLLDELVLSGNPWNCDCNTVHFQTWLQDNYRSVRNFEDICCSSDGGVYSNQPIYRLKKSQLCPQQVLLVNYLDVLNTLMAVVIFVIIVKLSYDYWLQKQTGKLPRFFSLNLS